MTTYATRLAAALDNMREFERMKILLNCLVRAPATEVEVDDAIYDLKDELEAEGLLEEAAGGGYYATTREGCDALIAYINGTDDEDDVSYDLTTEDE